LARRFPGTSATCNAFDGTVRLWDPRTGVEAGQLVPRAGSEQLRRFLASAGAGADIPIWLLVGSPHSVAYSPDGARLAVACGTNGILLFDLDTGDQLGRLPVNDGHHLVAQEAVAFSADDTLLVAVCADQTIRRWGTDTGAEIRRSAMDPYFGTRSVAFSPDGGRLAVACRDRTVRLWDLVPAVGDHPAGR
jgi:WD40 repeat protein